MYNDMERKKERKKREQFPKLSFTGLQFYIIFKFLFLFLLTLLLHLTEEF